MSFAQDGRKSEGEEFYSQFTRGKNSGSIFANIWASVKQKEGGSWVLRVWSNVNFFQMKTRQHPYWLCSLCGTRKTNFHDPFPGQWFDANSVGQLEPKGNLYVNVPLNLFFLFSPLNVLSLQDYVNTQAIQPKHLSVQCSVAWDGHRFSQCTGLATICPLPSCMKVLFKFVGLLC